MRNPTAKARAAARLPGRLPDLLFPRRCPWCGRVQGFAGACPCEGAPGGAGALRLPPAPLPVDRAAGHTHLEQLWACRQYGGAVRNAILAFKFQGRRQLAAPLAACLAERFNEAGLAGRYDVLVPVPVSAGTRRQRGYSQCALLAARLARQTGLPAAPAALAKVVETAPQMTLGRGERMANVRGAFSARPDEVAGRAVLLIDDIVTTGSTLDACAAALLRAGAARVGALCLAATPPPGAPGAEEAGEADGAAY